MRRKRYKNINTCHVVTFKLLKKEFPRISWCRFVNFKVRNRKKISTTKSIACKSIHNSVRLNETTHTNQVVCTLSSLETGSKWRYWWETRNLVKIICWFSHDILSSLKLLFLYTYTLEKTWWRQLGSDNKMWERALQRHVIKMSLRKTSL